MADEQLYFSKDKLAYLIETSQQQSHYASQEEVLRRVKQIWVKKLLKKLNNFLKTVIITVFFFLKMGLVLFEKYA